MRGADLSGARSVLFLRYDRLGDMVISTGLFRLVKEEFPGIRVHVLASPSNCCVIRNDPNVDGISVFRKKKPLELPGLLRSLRRHRFDAVVNLVFYPSFTGAVIARLSAPRRAVRVRVATEDSLDHFYNVNIRRSIWGGAKRTMLEETVSILEVLGGSLEGRDIRPLLFPGEGVAGAAPCEPSGGGRRIGVNLPAGDAYREWTLEKWTEAVQMMLERFPGITVHAFTPPSDPRGAQLAERFPGGRVLAAKPSSDILEVCAGLSRMDVLVTPDTAMVHMADALGVPVVAMYISREKLTLWKPCRVAFEAVVSRDGTMDSISAGDVVNALAEMMKERN
ncbi:MAG: glycosyltransferase family 9 protein [Candidatus Fermentibacteraceae bacterium]